MVSFSTLKSIENRYIYIYIYIYTHIYLETVLVLSHNINLIEKKALAEIYAEYKNW